MTDDAITRLRRLTQMPVGFESTKVDLATYLEKPDAAEIYMFRYCSKPKRG